MIVDALGSLVELLRQTFHWASLTCISGDARQGIFENVHRGYVYMYALLLGFEDCSPRSEHCSRKLVLSTCAPRDWVEARRRGTKSVDGLHDVATTGINGHVHSTFDALRT